MYISCGDMHTRITCDGVADANDLRTSQEEANTCLLLHAKHPSSNIASVNIIAEDMDIITLCLAFQNNIGCNMFVKCGSKTHTQFIDINKVSRVVGHDVCMWCTARDAVLYWL